jgi:hypothetical protein
MTPRIRLALILLIVCACTWPIVQVGTTLTAVVFDAAEWSVPAQVHMAVAELRAAGHEIRVVDVDVTNGEDQPPAELRDSLAAAKQHGLPALVFHSGGRIATADVPTEKDEFLRAVQ